MASSLRVLRTIGKLASGNFSSERGSVTITESAIVIAFSKEEVETDDPLRKVGYDLNEKSVVGSDGTRRA